ncbi:sigma-54 interaction domain-containing protein [Pseudomonas plecoglossicida]|uniref:Sigma-54-dependent Fis family transcriptional regulator n=1 Tax=Pseudomonas plecoglossicida TaxID=70775 RepID=A0AAD0R6P3_PSEDL|nr:sigma-54 dependent transcriptional regulator [Pseudomonas plecoglossicida]AXM98866.1 sigma-54-dependent Fis family transcriptional regulator [Pseudomonas plecoglossicida]QLB55014.1 sigma-54-dependent Fis family transcriptional regulator [Pseudomonas plecoglossicida]
MRTVGQTFNYSRTEALGSPAGPSTVVVVGSGDDSGYALLVDTLRSQCCHIACYDTCSQIDTKLLAQGALVFLFVSRLSDNALRLQADLLIGRVPHVSVVPIVAYAEQSRAAALLDNGCVDYLLAPFSESQITGLLKRQEASVAVQESFVSCSQAGRRLLAMAQRVAVTRAPILITGETGTGKEMMARYIHQFATGDKAPFVAVNCAAIPEQMLESLLFGHERGAFTGAVSAQSGKFEMANGGTLLLDEIGELPLGLQAKLLRVLQEQCVERLGGHKQIKLDVRVIAATNRDLTLEVAEGRFRADLMFRLDVLPLHITPLRDRPDDILPLSRRFIARYAPQEQADDLLTDAASRALLLHDWPGNVRELENTLQRALVMRKGLFIQAQDLGLPAGARAAPTEPSAPFDGRAALRASGKCAEYQHVLDTIRKFDGHKSKAAQSLGMTPRALRYRLSAMREQGVQLPAF